MTTTEMPSRVDFIRAIINADIQANKHDGRVHTRFPPEPNGYLHIGHAKSICLNFGIGQEYGGKTNLRFDDTNPSKEEQEYVDSIIEDVRWLGFDWEERQFFASDYFNQLYEYAIRLIEKGKAYVDDLTAEQISAYRGTGEQIKQDGKIISLPGRDSPYRQRSVEENLNLFKRMRAGEFPDGAKTLRAKIDMASPNIYLRDPVLYRILRAYHHRAGNQWLIYPTYDWAHGLCDSLEGITHSICTLEFEIHRPLYDWILKELNVYQPQQIEFARLNLTYTVLSKRYLLELVSEGHARGWDDPRMPTLSGLRRRGFTPEAIRNFCRLIGVSKTESVVDIQLLEHCLREDLNRRCQRVMGVIRPLKVVIENYPEGQVEEFEAVNNPEDPSAGMRRLPFSRELYIEQDDFMENPPKDFFRLAPGREVRLRYAYFIKCREALKDPVTGQPVELRCVYDPATRGGAAPDQRKVKATLHWVSAPHSIPAEVRIYHYLFNKEDPYETPNGGTYKDNLNPKSLETLSNCRLEISMKNAAIGSRYQFERLGYFCVDKDSTAAKLVFNRAVTLKDAWAKIKNKK